jgi:hypothetical protein
MTKVINESPLRCLGHAADMRERRNAGNIIFDNLKRRDHLRDIGIDGR